MSTGHFGKPKKELLGIYLALYDTLVDDDDEVRDKGAAAVSALLSGVDMFENGDRDTKSSESESTFTALAAKPKLVRFLLDQYPSSIELWLEAMHRLVRTKSLDRPLGVDKKTPLRLGSARGRFQESIREDTALFAEEKQNMFIDEAQEAATWLDVLVNLKISKVDDFIASELTTWIIEGIQEMLTKAESEIDGPLGWTSKPEVFALGMTFILAGQAVIRLSAQRILHTDTDLLRKQLRRLLDLGQEKSLHPRWLRAIQETLKL